MVEGAANGYGFCRRNVAPLFVAWLTPLGTRRFYAMTGYGPDEVLGHNW